MSLLLLLRPTPALTGGSISTSVTNSGAAVNLSAQGFDDWAMINGANAGSGTASIDQRKSGGGSTIGGSNFNQAYNNSSRTISWTDGTPTASASLTSGSYAMWNATPSNVITVTFPATTASRRALIYCGVYRDSGTAVMKVTASLSDGSTTPVNFDGISPASTFSVQEGWVTIDYQAASTCTLTVQIYVQGSSSTFENVSVDAMGWKTLTTSQNLDGNAASVATVNGSLTVGKPLAGDAAAVSTVAGSITKTVPLSGSAAAVAAVSGSVTQTVPLAGNAASVAAVTGSLTQGVPLTGAAAAVSTVTGSITKGVPLSGNLASIATLTGDVSTTGSASLSGTIAVVSTASGNLTKTVPLAGAAAAVATASGSITKTVSLTGSAASVASVSGSVNLSVPLTGSIAAISAVAGSITVQSGVAVALTGSIVAAASVSGALSKTATLSGNIAAVSTVTGNAGIQHNLSGLLQVEPNLSGYTSNNKWLDSAIQVVVSAPNELTVVASGVPDDTRTVLALKYGDTRTVQPRNPSRIVKAPATISRVVVSYK